jgi:hypothetical protein
MRLQVSKLNVSANVCVVWIAGTAVIVAACFGLAIHSAGCSRLEWKNRGSG